MAHKSIRVLAVMSLVLLTVGLSATAGADPPAPERPFQATFSGYREIVSDPGRCDTDYTALDITLTSGHATHLGRITATAEQCINLATGVIVDGEATYVAANGDELYANYSGAVTGAVDGLLEITIDQDFDDGTGRFEGATGHGLEIVYVDGDGNVQGTIQGDISY
jgi:hypothetical protein